MKKSFFIGYKGSLEAYIYIWFSKQNSLVYVGETNNIHGVVGRADQHVSKGGTLYCRLHDAGYELEELEDLILLSYPLPREKKFMSEETAYRISVEYLVQKNLLRKRIDSHNPYKLISNVTPGPHVSMKRINKIAENIVNDFWEIYEEELL